MMISGDSSLHSPFSLLLFFLCAGCFLFLACSEVELKNPEEYARFERIVDAVKTLERAYAKQDIEAIHDLLLPLDSLAAWQREVQRDFQAYADISLDLVIDRIEIDGDLISAYISWHGVWKRTAGGSGLLARGDGILHWNGTQVILLSGVEGDLPFGMADRQSVS